MFNREYHRRAARLALARAGVALVRDAESGFYRPAKRPDPRPARPAKPGAPEQLKLNFSSPQDFPLIDIFPEAYEIE